MNNQTQMNTPEADDQLSLWDILNFLKEGWHWLAGGLVVGLVGAVGFVLYSPAQFEAMAILQPATVGLPTTTTTTKGAEVEPVAQTLERLKLATFYSDPLVQTCQASSTQALIDGIKTSQVKGNSLIQVSYRAPSIAVAEACVNAVVAQLVKSQGAIAEPLVKTLEEQLVLTRKQLAEAESFQGRLEKRALASADSASLLVLSTLTKREEIVRLEKQVVEQKIQLSVPLTQPMQLLEPIYAPEKAVAPKKLPVLAGGLFGGLVLGGLVFFVRRSWQARKAA